MKQRFLCLFMYLTTFTVFGQSDTSPAPAPFICPEGFTVYNEPAKQNDTLYACIKGDPADMVPDCVVQYIRTARRITTRHYLPVRVQLEGDLSTFPVTWQNEELVGIRSEENFGSFSVVTRVIYFPVEPNAIKLKLSGPASEEETLIHAQNDITESFQGELSLIEDAGDRSPFRWWVRFLMFTGGITVILLSLSRIVRAANKAKTTS